MTGPRDVWSIPEARQNRRLAEVMNSQVPTRLLARLAADSDSYPVRAAIAAQIIRDRSAVSDWAYVRTIRNPRPSSTLDTSEPT